MTRVFTIIFLLLPFLLPSQTTYRQYDTQRYYYEHLPKTGSGSGILGEPGRAFAQRMVEEKIRARSKREDVVKKRNIGILFHVISDENYGQMRSKIAQQLTVLNKAFNEKPNTAKNRYDPTGRFLKTADHPRLRFYATEIEGFEKGIRQVSPGKATWRDFDEMKDEAKGGLGSKKADLYVNVWITALPDDMHSYATSAYIRDDFSGIVLDESLLPDRGKRGDFSEGKSLVHLMGNYFGLYDLWNDYEKCADDYVSDTPIHNMANRGHPQYKHVTTCVRDRLVPEMVVNYMDNTADDMQLMFTAGQIRRMHAVIEATLPALSNDAKTMGDAQ